MANETPVAVITEDLLLPGWDPDEPVPATIYRPEGRDKLPVVVVLHGFGCSKQESAPLLPRLAGAGFLAVAIDGFLHGQRREPSVFKRELADLADDFAIWVHQTCVSHTVRDVSRIIDSLGDLPQAHPARIGVTGVSMGGCSARLSRKSRLLRGAPSRPQSDRSDVDSDDCLVHPSPSGQTRRGGIVPHFVTAPPVSPG